MKRVKTQKPARAEQSAHTEALADAVTGRVDMAKAPTCDQDTLEARKVNHRMKKGEVL